MYDKLLNRLRTMPIDIRCAKVMREAADAIEELSKDLERSKDFEAFWQHAAEEELKKFQVAISNKPRWIPVTERLPEFEGAVLCMRKSNVCGVRPYQEILYVDEYGFMNFDSIYLADGVVTHWMPLPQPPKEE